MMKPTRGDLRRLLHHALKHPWYGQSMISSRHYLIADSLTEPGRETAIILTYDVGYHSSGWWKNSDYDKCLHLSVAHPNHSGLVGARPDAPSEKEVQAWAKAMFGDEVRRTWTEPPASAFDAHRETGVAHVRLFLNKAGEPITPKGEVYNLKPWADGGSPMPKLLKRRPEL
jgi:hypothetical protein